MQSGSGVDLFRDFNEGEVSEVLRRCAGCSRFVLIGPPRSGKTFFKENYLEGKLGAGVTVDECTLGISTTAKTGREEARSGLGILGKVMKYLEGMILLIKRLRDKASVEDEELRKVLGDKAPRLVVEGARRSIGDSPHMAYYIPWKCVEESNACTSNKDVSRALELIKKVFDDRKIRIRWFKAEYVPPGLVEEVIDLIRVKGEDGAREELKGWVEAYSKAGEALSKVLGLGEDLLKWDELSIGFLSNFVINYASYVTGGLAAIPLMGAASLALISVLTYMAFKREGEGYLKGIIELKRSLERLRRSDGEFNELGKLLVYRVAYAMGMSYDEAKEALMDITGLSIDELERRVNEIEGRIKELEEKIELFRQEVPAGIVTADVNEFAKGRTYPNIKVENGELRIRVGGGYHSIVRAGKFNELVNEVKGRLVDDGVVVVVGPKGVGKSTLATTVIWELFMNGDIGLVARVDRLDSKNYSEFATFVENYGEYFGRLLILYDPVSTKAYEKVDVDVETPIQASIEWTVKNLIDVINSISSEATKPLTLIVLPSDIYNALNSDMRAKLESHSLDAAQKLINTEFLAELIREYTKTRNKPSGCALSNNVLSKLVDELTKFDSGHALIARLIGRELARNNCDVDEVKELINKAKSKAETFIILHINGLFKVNKTSDTTKEAIVKVFALRRPFVSWVRPGDPILTPGVVKLMGVSGLSGWLAIRQHDLIEGAIKKLLDCIVSENEECKDLSDALEPWVPRTVGLLREVSEKVKDVDSAIEYFASNYGKRLTEDGLSRFSNCWKRAALIIGYALASQSIVSRPEDVPDDVVESLGDVLKRCGVDDYLLVGNEIPLLIMGLAYTRALTEAFIDKYDEAAAEVRRVLNIIKSSSDIFDELLYGLGLASIIANAAESSRDVKPSDADAALHIASLAMHRVVVWLETIMPILRALEPLRDKAPQRYLEVLASALYNASTLDISWNTDMNILLNEFDYILNKYGDGVKGHAWPLIYVIDASIKLFYKRIFYERPENLGHCDNYMFEHMDASFRKDLEHIVSRVAGLLNEIKRLNPSLGIIAWAHALQPALGDKCIRTLMESMLGIDVVNKAKEVIGELSRLRVEVQELMRDEDFMGFVESWLEGTGEKVVRRKILEETSTLKHALAHYRLINGELNEAEELFNEAAEERREIDEYDYLDYRGWALRVVAIKGSLAGDDLVNLVDKLGQLYEEARKLDASLFTDILGRYLVSLALMGDHETINKLLEEHLWVLNANRRASVLTRLMLNALLSPRGRLNSELKGKLSVNPEELIDAFEYNMLREYRPALRVTFKMISPEEGYEECKSIEDSTERRDCRGAVLAVMDDSDAVGWLRGKLINDFHEQILKNERSGWLRELGFDTNALISEFGKLVYGLDGKSLAQLIAPASSIAQLALMLHALINGNKELAKAHALYGAIYYSSKLLRRLFLEAYRACCDLESESFRLAIARLFFYHI